jgi:NADH-quinone oxidoreductase subunit M
VAVLRLPGAFAVKVPMFPVHTWLPDAHVEAPTGGSVILAAIMLKIGGYGFLRFSLPIVPGRRPRVAWLVIALSLIAVVYIGLVALVQEDMKKLIAYSSISHMGFVTLGTFIAFALVREAGADGAALGLQGAMVQMISHGFISGAMFSCVGVLYDRMHSRMIATTAAWPTPCRGSRLLRAVRDGQQRPARHLGFVGEFMVILAAFQASPGWPSLAGLTLILGAAYTLWLVKRVIFGEVGQRHVAELKDLNGASGWCWACSPSACCCLASGPKPLTDLMDASIATRWQLAAEQAVGG